jgi:hypothetical protein
MTCKAPATASVAWRSLLTAASDLDATGGRIMAKRQGRSQRKVRDIMVEDVVSIGPTEQAMQTMAQAQVGRLPVLDDEDQLVFHSARHGTIGDISGKNHRATGEGAAEFRGTATKSLPEFRGAQIPPRNSRVVRPSVFTSVFRGRSVI